MCLSNYSRRMGNKREGEIKMGVILNLIGVSVLFSIGLIVGAWWNYVHTINKQIERIDEYLKKENERFELIKGGKGDKNN